jgi:hypothetical protein
MTTLQMRTYASSLGHKTIGLTNEKLKEIINLPEEGEHVQVKIKKHEPEVSAIFMGMFQCKKTNKFYARLTFNPASKKYFVKQLQKITRHENTTETTIS